MRRSLLMLLAVMIAGCGQPDAPKIDTPPAFEPAPAQAAKPLPQAVWVGPGPAPVMKLAPGQAPSMMAPAAQPQAPSMTWPGEAAPTPPVPPSGDTPFVPPAPGN